MVLVCQDLTSWGREGEGLRLGSAAKFKMRRCLLVWGMGRGGACRAWRGFQEVVLEEGEGFILINLGHEILY